MKAPPHPRNADRLAALRAFEILDTPRDRDLDDIVAFAADLCGAPISVINLIDADRQWFKAEVGLGIREMGLDDSICAHAILTEDFVEIPDMLADPRMADNPLCTSGPGLRFYAGALLKTQDDLPLGTLCILDTRPRSLTQMQARTLQILARQVVKQFELSRALIVAERMRREADHRVKNSLAAVAAVLRMQARKADPVARPALEQAQNRIATVAALHEAIGEGEISGDVDLTTYLPRVVALSTATRPPEVHIALSVAPLTVPSQIAAGLGMIISEVLMNALKHAFPNGGPGNVAVTLTRTETEGRLTIADDGNGSVAAGEGQKGLGLLIVEAAVAQVGGRMETGAAPMGGMQTQVTFPLPGQTAP